MTEVIGFWMAMSFFVVPFLIYIICGAEVVTTKYLNSITNGRYVVDNKFTYYILDNIRGSHCLAIFFGLNQFALYWLCIAWIVEGGSILPILTQWCENLTFVFWPVVIACVLFLAHKTLKKIVTFGYKIHDHLEGSDK